VLRDIELEILRRVVPEYREAVLRDQVEVSTSPFYHPILPLLCDTDVYLRTHPQSRMPRERFQYPEDALEQLTRAVTLHERLFGRRPAGVWPSEGSVSDAMVPLVARAGFSWMATDEEILARSLEQGFARDGHGHLDQSDVLYRPYVVGRDGQTVRCGFRDHALSDLIGFTYASWSPEAAADDFVARLTEAGRRASAKMGGVEPTIFVILDGENAWEYYEGQGRPFLRALYRRLAASRDLRTVTMTEACAGPGHAPLPAIFPGSWINGDFYIWIGHADDHRAWGQLAEARRTLASPPSGVSPAALARAREEMLIAEGSDWFWWYGDDHSSDHDREFDELFRRHVQNVYRALGLPIPGELLVSNISTQPPDVQIDPPTGFVTPVIDGEATNYFEWLGAGTVEIEQAAGAMHQVSGGRSRVSLIEFGFDPEHLYVRVSATGAMTEVLADGVALTLNFLAPVGLQVMVRRSGGVHLLGLLTRGPGNSSAEVRGCDGGAAAVRKMVELKVPFSCLGVTAGGQVAFLVGLNRSGSEVEHYPQLHPIAFRAPDAQFVASHWTA
jgi:alpha-amylase/alpha-mannosidase (GH57 family)